MNDRDLHQSLARQSFHVFIRLVFLTINPGRIIEDNWHIAAIAHAFERVWMGRPSASSSRCRRAVSSR